VRPARELPGPGHWMKILLALLILALSGCNLPADFRSLTGGRATPTVAPTDIPTPTPAIPQGPLGTRQNPLVLALPPSTTPKPQVIEAGHTLTSLLEKTTGYSFVSVIPPTEAELIRAFAAGNAHIGSLSPFGYLLAADQDSAEAAFGREQDGKIFYGAQFIVRARADTLTYYDPIQDKNLAEADVALAQFNDKKPCWTDEHSPSGYIVPLGILKAAGVATREPAFLASHAAVVRAVYAGGICDFGATYIDARLYPGLEDELPDVVKKVDVVWRIPEIIPFETLVFGRKMPVEVRRVLIRAFVDLTSDNQGAAAMQTLYGFSTVQVTQDSQYAEFRKAVDESGISLTSLVQ
jgi:phosphate/phosphite/phosphonate ABC transporter binding protein